MLTFKNVNSNSNIIIEKALIITKGLLEGIFWLTTPKKRDPNVQNNAVNIKILAILLSVILLFNFK